MNFKVKNSLSKKKSKCDNLSPRGIIGKFFWGGKVIFPHFFPGVKCFFLVENFHFGRPKTDFCCFEKWQANKRVLSSFLIFSLLPFSIFHLPFYNFPSFLLHFPLFSIFPCLFFPGRSAEISRSEDSRGVLCPPPACYATAFTIEKGVLEIFCIIRGMNWMLQRLIVRCRLKEVTIRFSIVMGFNKLTRYICRV